MTSKDGPRAERIKQNVVSLLGQRGKRGTNIETTLRRHIIAGLNYTHTFLAVRRNGCSSDRLFDILY